ncbi:helix-turn-helix domain-containing protein (plasmid) [Macrococcus psychrotolerans]|uniref:Helix-turn-helix domain-containing protein n=2 Tax=Staphylococcaceae TaxID=90964 RepID=A0A8F8LP84_9STAP|nr:MULTISPECIES: helix-turn-helix domain-containing protein [Macrococcus]QYA33990.1 MarR family transcriptional regulator [Macrococcus sp. 19Msa1099]QYA38909.1 MarR family transcriptional regulator [Macrococcus caseolyticus]
MMNIKDLAEAEILVRKMRKPLRDELDVAIEALGILYMLEEIETDGLTALELCGLLHMSHQRLSPILKSLEIKGYVSRKRKPTDERSIVIFMNTENKENYRILKSYIEEL